MRVLLKNRWLAMAAVALAVAFGAADGVRATPIATDSRIKTFVYNANEVFSVTTHYGYQSNIEFGSHESIDTVSVGDRVGWQIVPAGRRLFIRAMEENAHTNMTVVTNERAYQFDLRSSSANAVFGSEELTYVVRFFYPDDVSAGAPAPVVPVVASAPPVATMAPVASSYVPPPMVVTPAAIPPAPTPTVSPKPAPAPVPAPVRLVNNYRYTYSGPSAIAPLKIYDDGRSTYFKLPADVAPQVAVITSAGAVMDVPARRTGDGLVVVDIVAPRFSIRQAGQQVIVYNEAAS